MNAAGIFRSSTGKFCFGPHPEQIALQIARTQVSKPATCDCAHALSCKVLEGRACFVCAQIVARPIRLRVIDAQGHTTRKGRRGLCARLGAARPTVCPCALARTWRCWKAGLGCAQIVSPARIDARRYCAGGCTKRRGARTIGGARGGKGGRQAKTNTVPAFIRLPPSYLHSGDTTLSVCQRLRPGLLTRTYWLGNWRGVQLTGDAKMDTTSLVRSFLMKVKGQVPDENENGALHSLIVLLHSCSCIVAIHRLCVNTPQNFAADIMAAQLGGMEARIGHDGPFIQPSCIVWGGLLSPFGCCIGGGSSTLP